MIFSCNKSGVGEVVLGNQIGVLSLANDDSCRSIVQELRSYDIPLAIKELNSKAYFCIDTSGGLAKYPNLKNQIVDLSIGTGVTFEMYVPKIPALAQAMGVSEEIATALLKAAFDTSLTDDFGFAGALCPAAIRLPGGAEFAQTFSNQTFFRVDRKPTTRQQSYTDEFYVELPSPLADAQAASAILKGVKLADGYRDTISREMSNTLKLGPFILPSMLDLQSADATQRYQVSGPIYDNSNWDKTFDNEQKWVNDLHDWIYKERPTEEVMFSYLNRLAQATYMAAFYGTKNLPVNIDLRGDSDDDDDAGSMGSIYEFAVNPQDGADSMKVPRNYVDALSEFLSEASFHTSEDSTQRNFFVYVEAIKQIARFGQRSQSIVRIPNYGMYFNLIDGAAFADEVGFEHTGELSVLYRLMPVGNEENHQAVFYAISELMRNPQEGDETYDISIIPAAFLQNYLAMFKNYPDHSFTVADKLETYCGEEALAQISDISGMASAMDMQFNNPDGLLEATSVWSRWNVTEHIKRNVDQTLFDAFYSSFALYGNNLCGIDLEAEPFSSQKINDITKMKMAIAFTAALSKFVDDRLMQGDQNVIDNIAEIGHVYNKIALLGTGKVSAIAPQQTVQTTQAHTEQMSVFGAQTATSQPAQPTQPTQAATDTRLFNPTPSGAVVNVMNGDQFVCSLDKVTRINKNGREVAYYTVLKDRHEATSFIDVVTFSAILLNSYYQLGTKGKASYLRFENEEAFKLLRSQLASIGSVRQNGGV